MTAGRRRTAGVLTLGVVVTVVTAALGFEPDAAAVLIATVLFLAGLTLLVQGVNPLRPTWLPPVVADPLTRGRDETTFADLRLLESHRTARRPDHHLSRRLAELADRALRTSHGVGLDSDQGRALVGPAVSTLLASPGRRLSTRDIDLCLRTIEEL